MLAQVLRIVGNLRRMVGLVNVNLKILMCVLALIEGGGMDRNTTLLILLLLQTSSSSFLIKPVIIRGRIHLWKCSHSPLSH